MEINKMKTSNHMNSILRVGLFSVLLGWLAGRVGGGYGYYGPGYYGDYYDPSYYGKVWGPDVYVIKQSFVFGLLIPIVSLRVLPKGSHYSRTAWPLAEGSIRLPTRRLPGGIFRLGN
jgi:hypothetical protein